jgi:hypothetical protein
MTDPPQSLLKEGDTFTMAGQFVYVPWWKRLAMFIRRERYEPTLQKFRVVKACESFTEYKASE